MIPALKAEFRKLFTIRSSYVIPGIALALMVFIGLYVEGYKNGAANTSMPGGQLFLASSLGVHTTIISIFGAIVALLALTHEYRYSTIMYSLTTVNRRSKMLAAKLIAVFAYVLGFVIISDLFGFACMIIGLHLAGHSLPTQDLHLFDYLLRSLFVCEGWAMIGLLLAALLRNQVAALAVLFIVPNTVEGLLSLLLKQNTVYLPFSALQQVTALSSTTHDVSPLGSLSPGKGALVFSMYLIAGWIVAWILFLKRDAN